MPRHTSGPTFRPDLEALENRLAPAGLPSAALDPSFGQGGSLLANFDTPVGQVTASGDLTAVGPDGKVVVVGTPSQGQSVGVVRLNPDGTRDASFGSNGAAGLTVSDALGPIHHLVGAAVQDDGKVVIAGELSPEVDLVPHAVYAVWRLTAGGAPDATFGSNGLATLDVTQGSDFAIATAFALGPNGTVVLAGTLGGPPSTAVLARFTNAGTADASFGGDGILRVSTSAIPETPQALLVQPDGKVLLAGPPPGVFSTSGPGLVSRLNADGGLDSSFGTGGTASIPGLTTADALALQPDGKVVVAGTAGGNLVLARLTTAGALDPTFHGDGLITTAPFGGAAGTSVPPAVTGLGIQPDGKVVVGVSNAIVSLMHLIGRTAVRRFTASGDVDATLGGGGVEQLDLPQPALKVQPDGKYLLVGADPSRSGGTLFFPPVVIERLVGAGDVRVGAAAVAEFDPATATWYIRSSASAGSPDVAPFQFGAPGWVPVVGDWDGDGVKTIGVVDPATMTWYLRNSNSPGAPDITPFQFGLPGWTPVVGDWDGNGKTEVGVVDPATETWYLPLSSNGAPPTVTPFQYGLPGWRPVVGDWNGDGKTDIGAVDLATETWYLRNSASAGIADAGVFQYGLPGWLPVAGDWGAGTSGVGVVDPSRATWYLRSESSAGLADAGVFAYGLGTWIPLSASS